MCNCLQAQPSQYQDQYAEDASTSERMAGQQQRQQGDRSSWRGSQQGASSSGSGRSSNNGNVAEPETDGYFRPPPEASWLQDTRDQNRKGMPDIPQSQRPGRASLSWGNRSKRGMDKIDGPYQLGSTSSSSSTSSQGQRQEGYDDEWGEQDGYFQPDADATQDRSRSKGMERRSRASPAAQQRKSGWQPSTEDWD